MALAAVALGVAACGGGSTSRQVDAKYPVRVSASFPTDQRLAQQTDLVVSVTNSGTRALPDVAVTILNPKYGTAVQSFQALISAEQPAGEQPLSSRSRPVWMIDREPGPCGFSCSGGGPGGAVSSYADTWALGKLAPGHTARFDWRVSAVKAGDYAVAYRVAAGLDAGEKAVLGNGAQAQGAFDVKIAGAPAQQHFTSSGQVVSGS
jgi:hypothetical protein